MNFHFNQGVWCDTVRMEPVTFDPYSEQTLVSEFERQALETPNSVAVEHEGTTLTYQELNRRANQVAHSLISLGVARENRVGLSLRIGLELVVGLVGILKAGAGYVPLDPDYPLQRLRYVIEDAQLSTIVTDGSVKEWGTDFERPLRIVPVGQAPGQRDVGSSENPAAQSGSANLAYIIYTSGSTGRPKGVSVTHRNVLRLFAVTQAWFCFSRHDIWTLFHSYSFDFSVWELWGGLLFGGKVILVSPRTRRSPDAFYRLLRECGVTVLNLTPSAFKNLSGEDASKNSELKVRVLIFGGEALSPPILAGWRRRHPETRLINMYGITEITVHGSYVELGDAEIANEASVIGEALPDLRFYVLDENSTLCPPGVAGELYVAGAGLARGYLHRPDLMAERFLPDLFASQPGERMYRTGDRVRWQTPERLEFLGRMDDQVKIRGYRIELGEIEAVLREHPEVLASAVTVSGEDEAKRLVAYVVAVEADRFELSGVVRHAELRLPDYMAPVTYVVLPSLPLTSNGKLDRAALPPPESSRAAGEPVLIRPRTAVEEVLCEIWAQVLGLDEVGVEDDFFEFGGHSLLATQVISQVRRVLGVEIGLHYLFEASTVAAFAKVLEEIHAQQEMIDCVMSDEVENLQAD